MTPTQIADRILSRHGIDHSRHMVSRSRDTLRDYLAEAASMAQHPVNAGTPRS